MKEDIYMNLCGRDLEKHSCREGEGTGGRGRGGKGVKKKGRRWKEARKGGWDLYPLPAKLYLPHIVLSPPTVIMHLPSSLLLCTVLSLRSGFLVQSRRKEGKGEGRGCTTVGSEKIDKKKQKNRSEKRI